MAARKPKQEGAGLQSDSGAVIPRVSLGESGFIGLRTSNGQILEEANRAFRFPAFLKTVNEMRNDPTIAAALNVYRMMINRVDWKVEPPVDATETEKQRADFVASCMGDMEGTWGQFISETVTYIEYGFSVQEKVYRRRLTRNGSKFNDGLVGLRKIATRSQDTIRHWNFSEDGRDLVSIGQSLVNLENGSRYIANTSAKDGVITIPRSKFMLFSVDSVKGNPEGKSLLKNVYLPYKQLTMLKDQLLLGVAKDMAAVPIVYLPPDLMDANAPPEKKAAYQAYQRLVDNVAAGTQKGMILPMMYDEQGKPMFEFKLMEAKANSKFDIPGIIEQLQQDIFVALNCDVIKTSGEGNFAVGESKTNLLALAIEHRLNEIRDVLNNDLIPQLYALNGWSLDRLPTFEYGDILDIDSEAFSKFVQRVGAVGMMEIDRQWLNKIREVGGIEPLPPDAPVDKENLTGAPPAGAGAGMAPGTTGEGTAKVGGKSKKTDKSAGNSDNAA
jgi:hypothetical protein